MSVMSVILLLLENYMMYMKSIIKIGTASHSLVLLKEVIVKNWM